MVSIGKHIKTTSENHQGYGAGSGTIETRVYSCPCGKGTFVDVYDNIPGFKDHDYSLNCDECNTNYNFDPISGNINEKE
jgi:hypothetical protein